DMLGALEQNLRVTDADAIAGMQLLVAVDTQSVEKSPVRRTAVLEIPGAVDRRNFRVLARQISIPDWNRAVGGTSNRYCFRLQLLAERRGRGRVNGDLCVGCNRCHGRGSERKIVQDGVRSLILPFLLCVEDT